MKKNLLAILLLITSLSANAQLSNQEKIAQVYGTFASQMTPEQTAWVNNCLSRCQIITADELPQGSVAQLLSTVRLQKKFVDVQPDAVFNAQTFNPLKYDISFFNKKDQYFTIDNTNYILKVVKKES